MLVTQARPGTDHFQYRTLRRKLLAGFIALLLGPHRLSVVTSDRSWAGYAIASFPGSCAGEEEREPGTHCSRMHQVPLVTCILLHYTKINGNFYLPAERPHCRVILPVRHLQAVLKSETVSL